MSVECDYNAGKIYTTYRALYMVVLMKYMVRFRFNWFFTSLIRNLAVPEKFMVTVLCLKEFFLIIAFIYNKFITRCRFMSLKD